MSMFDEKVQSQLKDILKGMQDPVTLVLFTQEIECRSCLDNRDFVTEFSGLSDLIRVLVYDFQKDHAKAEEYHVDKIPCFVVLDKDGRDRGIKFYGLPGGYEINSFIFSLIETSGRREPLPPEISSRIAAIDKDVHLQVFVGLTCPYCPSAVATAHRLALENDRIRADMVDAAVFPHLAMRYQVSGIPKTIINETHELIGAEPITRFLDIIEAL